MKAILKNNREIITYSGFYILGFIISIILFAVIDNWYLYEYLIGTPFIIAETAACIFLDKKLLNYFKEPKKNLNRNEKSIIFFSTFTKFLILVVLLIISILFLFLKLNSINGIGLLVSVIITFIIILSSEIFKIYKFKNLSK